MKKRKVNPNRQALSGREVARQAKHFVYWRKGMLDSTEEPVTHTFVATVNRLNINPELVEYTLNNSDVFYQCLTITYCRDQWGKQYKLFGYARSLDTVILAEESVAPIIQAARGYAESNANSKHIIGHGMIMTPIFKHGVSIGDVAVKLRKQLDLDEKELKSLKECIDSEAAICEVDRREQSDIDEELTQLLKA